MTGDGVFLCSGIIDTRAEEVAAALEENGLRVIRRREQNGWVSLAAEKALSETWIGRQAPSEMQPMGRKEAGYEGIPQTPGGGHQV